MYPCCLRGIYKHLILSWLWGGASVVSAFGNLLQIYPQGFKLMNALDRALLLLGTLHMFSDGLLGSQESSHLHLHPGTAIVPLGPPVLQSAMSRGAYRESFTEIQVHASVGACYSVKGTISPGTVQTGSDVRAIVARRISKGVRCFLYPSYFTNWGYSFLTFLNKPTKCNCV